MKIFNELPSVLGFYSVSFPKYIGYSMMILLLFILFIGLSIPLYIFTLKYTGHFYYFLVFPALFLLSYFKLRKKVFLKNQLKLNVSYVEFLEKEKGNKLEKESAITEEVLKQTDRALSDAGLKRASSKLILAFQGLMIYHGTAGGLKKIAWKLKDKSVSKINYLFVEISLFLVMMIPFIVISLFLTRGMSPHIQFFIYLLGSLFAFFLHALIFEPIFFLLTQKRLWKEIS